ncbi:hypothetical protein BLOT_003876 [Blomia tropicalis]|nr:hypothetical protein BLOT_003876 [Blomia tropicalis]
MCQYVVTNLDLHQKCGHKTKSAIAAIDMNGVCGFLVLITSSLAAVQRFALKCSVPVLHAKPRLMVSIMGPIECGARSPTN